MTTHRASSAPGAARGIPISGCRSPCTWWSTRENPWAAATAPLLTEQLQDAGFTVSLYPVSTAAQAGSILGNGFADLALLPRTTSPYNNQMLSWYSLALGAPGQERLAGLVRLRQRCPGQPSG